MTSCADVLKLYLVTDRDLVRGRSVVEVVRSAVDGGVTAVQIREKDLEAAAFLNEAAEVKKVLLGRGVPLFVNDRADIALAAGADGLHVGQTDLQAATARRLIGPEMLLGVSVSTEDEARKALADGADYVSVSPVFLTPTKPDADAAVGLAGIRRIRRAVGTAAVLAIGGIDTTNARSIVTAGSDGVSVVSAIMSADDPRTASRALRREVDEGLAERGAR